MIPAIVAGQSCFLCTEEANWSTPPTLAVSKQTDGDRSATGRSVRTPLSASLLCEMSWVATLPLREMNALRNALQDATDEDILVPAWPFVHAGTDWSPAHHVGGKLVIGWKGNFASYAIADLTAGDAFTPADWDYVAPLLWGYFSAAPKPTAITH